MASYEDIPAEPPPFNNQPVLASFHNTSAYASVIKPNIRAMPLEWVFKLWHPSLMAPGLRIIDNPG